MIRFSVSAKVNESIRGWKGIGEEEKLGLGELMACGVIGGGENV